MFPSLRGRLSELWQLTSWLGFPGGSDGKKEKDLPAMPETWVHSLGQEDPLEKGMATQSSILAWRILWTEDSGGLQSMGSQRVGHELATKRDLVSKMLQS